MTWWSEDQLARKQAAEAGLCVVSNHRHGVDAALIEWANLERRFVGIDRRGPFGSPYAIGSDGTRDEVHGMFARWLKDQTDLLTQMPTLRGKVLICLCHPKKCHGDIIAEVVNREAAGEGTALEIAAMIANEQD